MTIDKDTIHAFWGILGASILLQAVSLICSAILNFSGCTSRLCLPLVTVNMHSFDTTQRLNSTLSVLSRGVSRLSHIPESDVFPALEEIFYTPATYKVAMSGYSRITATETTYHTFPNSLKAPYMLLNELALHMPDSFKWQKKFPHDYRLFLANGEFHKLKSSLREGDHEVGNFQSLSRGIFGYSVVSLVFTISVMLITIPDISDYRADVAGELSLVSATLLFISIFLEVGWTHTVESGDRVYFMLQKKLRLHLAMKFDWAAADALWMLNHFLMFAGFIMAIFGAIVLRVRILRSCKNRM